MCTPEPPILRVKNPQAAILSLVRSLKQRINTPDARLG